MNYCQKKSFKSSLLQNTMPKKTTIEWLDKIKVTGLKAGWLKPKYNPKRNSTKETVLKSYQEIQDDHEQKKKEILPHIPF